MIFNWEIIMLKLSNGLNVDQLKKYAKKLKKEKKITLNEAQNFVAQKYSDQNSWKKMLQKMKANKNFSLKSINNRYHHFELKKETGLLLCSLPGMGSGTVLQNIVSDYCQFHKGNILSVNFIKNYNVLNKINIPSTRKNILTFDGQIAIKNSQEIRSILLNIYDSINNKTELVIIDEFHRLVINENNNNNNIDFLLAILQKCCKLNIPIIFHTQLISQKLYKSIESYLEHILIFDTNNLKLFKHIYNDYITNFSTQVKSYEGVDNILNINLNKLETSFVSFSIN